MVAVEHLMSRESVNYRELVREIVSRSIARSRLKKGQFADALTEELVDTPGRAGNARKVHHTTISKWLSGADMPGADALVAVMKVGGLTPTQILEELDYMPSARQRVEDLATRMALVEAHLAGEHDAIPSPACPLCNRQHNGRR